MLCPEVWDFSSPKVFSSCKTTESLESVEKTIQMNSFYKSLVITCPDLIQTPGVIEEIVIEDTDYYKLSNCSLTEFVEPFFIESFVKNGKLYCLTSDRNCIVNNCACITPDGVLTVHLLEFIFQTIGLEGTKRPHNFYEVTIDLKNLKSFDKLKQSLSRLENFDFYISWEPNKEDICPSSIAKYFYDREVEVSVGHLQQTKLMPTVTEIPSVKDVHPDEMAEWIGMLAIQADLSPTEAYISIYSPPESENALKSTRISVHIIKGFITPTMLNNVCKKLSEYVNSRNLDDYWASMSIQSQENSVWQWHASSPKMFQAQDCSCTIFLTQYNQIVYSLGQLKYS